MQGMNRKLRVFTGTFVEAVLRFMSIGGQTTGKFNARQACLYTGLQLEALAEKIAEIQGGCVTPEARDHLTPLIDMLVDYGNEFKRGLHEGDILRANHGKLIDADFDLAWVSIGALASTSVAPHGAIAHGAFTNLDKFVENANGDLTALKDANGKIQKRMNWQPPDFDSFVDMSPRE